MMEKLSTELWKLLPAYREVTEVDGADGPFETTIRFFFKSAAEKVAACIRAITGMDVDEELKDVEDGFFVDLHIAHGHDHPYSIALYSSDEELLYLEDVR